MESLFTKLIIVISFIWLLSIFTYAYKNDFSSEILSFFLPVLGAIFLSVFVGIKFIFFDAPKDPEPIKLTVVIIHDKKESTLYGLGCSTQMFNGKTLNQQGLANLRTYNTDEMMNHNNIRELLSKDPIGSKFGEHDENDGVIFSKTVFDFLEFNILEWLSRINNVSNSWFNKEYIYNFPSGLSQEAVNIADSSMIKKIKIDKTIFPKNILFDSFSIDCLFPSGTIIKETRINDFRRIIYIKTDYSTIEITIQQLSTGLLNTNNADILNDINISNFDNKRCYTGINYQIEIQTITKPVFRFSREAKLHPLWHKLLIEKFTEAYSFEEFQKRSK